MPEVIRSVRIHAGPASVWRWLANEEALRCWLGRSLDIDLRVGGDYRLLGPDERTWISGVVLELQPERALVLSWVEEGAGWVHPARLAVTLDAVEGGTEVTLVHDGFAGIGTANWAGVREAYERGADVHRVLDRLAGLVAGAGV